MLQKLCCIATISSTLEDFVVPAMQRLKDEGYEVTLLSSMSPSFLKKYSNTFRCVSFPFRRGMSIIDVFVMPFKLYFYFKKEGFDYVQYATPNASFYSAIGARLAGIPKRVYCQWGIRYVGFSGIKRKVFKSIEKLTCVLSTHIRPASWKNLDYAVQEGLYLRDNATVIGDGGTVGIDLKQFDVNKKPFLKRLVLDQYPQLRNKTVFCFVGRFNQDKGVIELLEAFQRLSVEREDVALMLIGNIEEALPTKFERIKHNPQIVITGWTNDVPKFISVSDVLVHPSYREGFSMVIQQAMAMEIPVVTTDIPGPSEVIEPNVSGILVKPQDVETLYDGMRWMIEHPEERLAMGQAGRIRCEEKFNRERMVQLTFEDRIKIIYE